MLDKLDTSFQYSYKLTGTFVPVNGTFVPVNGTFVPVNGTFVPVNISQHKSLLKYLLVNLQGGCQHINIRSARKTEHATNLHSV